jgi:hypothetical protein
MIPHPEIGGGWLFLLLMLTTPAGAAPESADSAGSPPPAGSATVVAPAPVGATRAAAPGARPRLSPEIASQISSIVPEWHPPTAEPAKKPAPSDPEVVKMDPLIVWGERLPKTDRLDWLTPAARDVELVKTYITPFDRYFLNRFTLPIFGISKEARARTMYEEDKRLRDMEWMNQQIDEIKRLDPAEAKALLSARNSIFTRSQEY